MLASGATSWGAWDVPAAKLSPPSPPPPGTGLLHLLTFNGATAFRRWKRPVPRCPFAARLLPLQWGHRLSAMETSSPQALPVCCPFAARLLKRALLVAPLLPASMGPPPFGDGNVAPQAHENVRLVNASMGPPPFGDGNVPDSWVPSSDHTPLQWGHRLSAMETLLRPGWESNVPSRFQWGHRLSAMETRWSSQAWPGLSTASMGPPPFGDGMTIVQAEVGRGYELQWGHRLSAMETSKSGRARNITSSGFNGATAFRRWKQRLPAASPRRQGCASMGPPPFGDGNVRWPVLDDQPGLHASMGPPPFGDGNDTDTGSAWQPGLVLQWGHRLSAMETLTDNE